VSSGKWYWEVNTTIVGGGTNNTTIGIRDATITTTTDAQSRLSGYGYATNGDKVTASASVAYGSAMANGDVIGVAFDADAGTITFFKNNTSQGVAFTGITGSYYPVVAFSTGTTSFSISGSINFGQRPFAYTPPTGFVALNTQNLPTPTISNGAAYMAATLYTGTGSALSVSNAVNGVSFQPDFVWVKGRSGATSHNLSDSVRGTASTLFSNTTGAENVSTQRINAFNSNGFSVGNDADVSTNTATYVGWQWNAGGSTVTNTSGSISAQVRANPTAGFSIVSYTGSGSSPATVGHGLGVAPKFMIFKDRAAASNWPVYHASLGNTSALLLDTTGASTATANWWNNTTPTSTVFTIGSNENPARAHIAYCFSEVAGYSAFGSYTANGNTDGPFVFTGFKPRWVMIKSTATAGTNWWVLDSSRNTFNVMGEGLFPQSSAAGASATVLDFLSNGFKIRGVNADFNNGTTDIYIYAAFAENPFKNSIAR